MRNLLLSILLVFGISVAPVSYIVAEDEPVVTVSGVEKNVVSSTSSSTVEPTVTSEDSDKEVSEKTNPWVSLIWKVAAILLGISTAVVTLAAKLGIKKIEKKLGFDIPDAVEAIAEGYLVKSINWTEEWATKKSEAPSSEDKLVETLRVAVEKAGESESVKKYIEEKGKTAIEKLLKSEDTPESATPKSK